MVYNYDPRVGRFLHVALGLLILVEGGVNLGLCIAGDRGLQLIAFHSAQVLGAMLFIWPRTVVAGACVLVCAFLAAACVHAFERTLPFDHLIYAVAVLLVLAQYRAAVRQSAMSTP